MPEKCKNCIHHKVVQEVDICDFVEYYDRYGCPVPYPYFSSRIIRAKGIEKGRRKDET